MPGQAGESGRSGSVGRILSAVAGATVIPLGRRLPGGSSHLPARSSGRSARPPGRPHRVPIRCCSGWGLACHRCHQRRGGLLPHLFTLTRPARAVRAVSFLCHFPSPWAGRETRLLRLAVSQHPALRSPDLPPGRCPGDRPTRSGRHCSTRLTALWRLLRPQRPFVTERWTVGRNRGDAGPRPDRLPGRHAPDAVHQGFRSCIDRRPRPRP